MYHFGVYYIGGYMQDIQNVIMVKATASANVTRDEITKQDPTEDEIVIILERNKVEDENT
jgi:hypothetical protein